MALLFDGTHLASDTSLEELHEFAKSIGLKREWFQDKNIPHYDILGRMKGKVRRILGEQVSSVYLVRHACRKPWWQK